MHSSSTSNFLVVILFLIVESTARGHSKTITYSVHGNDLRAHCSFNFNGYEYDLCRLVGSPRAVDVVPEIVLKADGTRGEESNSRRGDYVLMLGDGDRTSNAANVNRNPCGKDGWVCISYKASRDAKNSSSNTFTLVRRESDSRILFMLDYEDEDGLEPAPRLQLTLTNGRHSPSAVITFSCDKVDKLDLVSVDEGRHFFVWSTPHGCPISLPSLFGMLQDSDQDGGQDTNNDNQKGDDELLPSDSRRARGWIAVVIVVSVLSLICGSILASSPRARHFVVEHVRSIIYALLPFLAEAVIRLKPIGQSIGSLASKTTFRFRQGDNNNLGRSDWAEEDMALDVEDLMLGSAMSVQDLEEVGWDGDGLDEYIPLTTSPKYGRGRRLQSYGATPEVDMFDQVDSGIGRYFGKKIGSRNTHAS